MGWGAGEVGEEMGIMEENLFFFQLTGVSYSKSFRRSKDLIQQKSHILSAADMQQVVKRRKKHQTARNDDPLLGVDFLFLPDEQEGENEGEGKDSWLYSGTLSLVRMPVLVGQKKWNKIFFGKEGVRRRNTILLSLIQNHKPLKSQVAKMEDMMAVAPRWFGRFGKTGGEQIFENKKNVEQLICKEIGTLPEIAIRFG
ncbi:hypothetical protein NE237_027380 [Protea cynaroides]|uniref:Uncharacterized protein n=1 Tax=Protea cynaroides TaxID=273540 RepID=A0A9Q0GMV4_9MAGN|nr:hypothetical protein NE237_027380 [Protea cynaroides]